MGSAAPSRTLHLAADVSIVCLVLSILFSITVLARRISTKQINHAESEVFAVSELEIENYNGKLLTGSQVVNLVQDFGSDVFIRIATKQFPTGFTNECQSDAFSTDAQNFSNVKNQDSVYYVDPVDSFVCSAVYNEVGNGVGFSIEQVGISDVLTLSGLQVAAQAASDQIAAIEAEQQLAGGDTH